MLVRDELHELRNGIDSSREELQGSPRQRAMNISLSLDTGMNQRVDEEIGNAREGKNQLNNGTQEIRGHSFTN